MTKTRPAHLTSQRPRRSPYSQDVGSPISEATEDATAELPWGGLKRDVWLNRSRLTIALCITASYVIFAAAVHFRLLRSLDLAVSEAARAGGVWGVVQARASRVVEDLQPLHLAIALAVIIGTKSIVYRSLRPIAVAGAVSLAAVIATLANKLVMARWSSDSTAIGHPSFPSEHTVTTILACGLLSAAVALRYTVEMACADADGLRDGNRTVGRLRTPQRPTSWEPAYLHLQL